MTLARNEAVGAHTATYLNRLSDALFVMARHENRRRGVSRAALAAGGLTTTRSERMASTPRVARSGDR